MPCEFTEAALPPPAIPPLTVALPSALDWLKNELTLPPMSIVHSPAGMIIPAFAAVAESAKTAPAAVFIYDNHS